MQGFGAERDGERVSNRCWLIERVGLTVADAKTSAFGVM